MKPQKQKAKPAITIRRPWLARAINSLGISTSSLTDSILSWVQVLLIAALLATLVILFVVMRVNVPTESMEPTISKGASFFVDKISYYFRKPTPGQFIVFWHNNVRLVKRLIAVGGQTVQIKDCYVYVDGKPLTDQRFNSPKSLDASRQCYANNARDPRTGSDLPSLMSDPSTIWEVPPGHYFVLGDNTYNSEDGRYWRFLKESDFIGVPFVQVWPLDHLGFVNGYFGSGR